MQLKEIKRMYRLYMNGIVSHSMREKGAEYRVNFGLTLPLLTRIAQQVTPSADIAEELWHDTGVRESMLLAPMLHPIEGFTVEDARRWIEEIPNIEVSDFCCKYLFSRLDYAPSLVIEYTRSNKEIELYTGFRLGYSLLDRENLSDEWIKTISSQAIDTAYRSHSSSGHAALRFLTEGLMSGKGRYIAETLQQSTQIDNEWREQLMTLYEP